jgi:hypothetical protein
MIYRPSKDATIASAKSGFSRATGYPIEDDPRLPVGHAALSSARLVCATSLIMARKPVRMSQTIWYRAVIPYPDMRAFRFQTAFAECLLDCSK